MRNERTAATCLISADLRDYQGDVIVLLARTELPNVIHNRTEHFLRGQIPVLTQRFGQSLLAVLFFPVVKCFRYAVGVERQGVARQKHALSYTGRPSLRESHYRTPL